MTPPAKKSDRKTGDRKSKNAMNKMVTREYTIHIHKYIHKM